VNQRLNTMRITLSIFLFCIFSNTMPAIEKAFPQTEVGQIEVKTLPASHLISSHSDRSYFDSNNQLFRPLFRYITSRDIAMTTPVEAEIEPGIMYFYIGEEAIEKAQESTENVTIRSLPERTVASIGARGGYSEANFRDAEAELRSWLAAQSDYRAIGAARGIYWNGPYVPGLFKRFEVHIPVEKQAVSDE
jgi:hypothetical protein